jgi:hypothetical protein
VIAGNPRAGPGDVPGRAAPPLALECLTMRFRLLGFGLILFSAVVSAGCCWWRPHGCWHHGCHYSAPDTTASPSTDSPAPAPGAPPARVANVPGPY